MNKSDPVRNTDELNDFKNYYLKIKPNYRNYLLIVFGLNTALRISDMLSIKWKDIYDSSKNIPKSHLYINERKTGKQKVIYINKNIVNAMNLLNPKSQNIDDYVFSHFNNGKLKISRVQAYRIIRQAADYYNIDGIISCHSLRKTFGYQARIQGADPTVLVDIFNHSSYEVTKRYLGIEQDDLDDIYKNIII